jgi:hypothetical protein
LSTLASAHYILYLDLHPSHCAILYVHQRCGYVFTGNYASPSDGGGGGGMIMADNLWRKNLRRGNKKTEENLKEKEGKRKEKIEVYK